MKPSPALSLANQPRTTIRTRKVALLVADGVRFEDYERACAAVCGGGGVVETVSHVLGAVQSVEGRPIDVCKTWSTAASVQYDALCVLGGEDCAESLQQSTPALKWIREAFVHAKPIGALQEGVDVIERAGLPDVQTAKANAKVVVSVRGVVTARAAAGTGFGTEFVAALQQHRHFDRATDMPHV